MFNKNESSPVSKNIETIICPSVKVEGDFKGEGDLIVEGILIGNLETKNNLKIGQNAIIQAEVRANNAFVSGKIKGNITVSGKIEIASTAVILGDIKAQIISIESGALIQGKIIMPVRDIKIESKVEDKEILAKINEKKKLETVKETL